MEDRKNKTFELIIGEDLMDDGVSTISFVEHPAIEEDFMFFSKEIETYKFAEEGDKFMVTGAAMIPNKKIVRMSEDNQKYYVVFSEETIAKCNELFFKRAQHISANVEHQFAVDGVTVVESWMIEDPNNDKANALGFQGLPKGTWMVSYKVDNEELWNSIKNGEVKGFSIEGLFSEKLVEMNKEEVEEPEFDLYEEIDKVLKSEEDHEIIYEKIQKLVGEIKIETK